MNDTPARLLKLLSLLQTPREWPGSELAERLGVSPRTVRRDVDRLRELGYPVEATMGAAGGYRLGSGTAMPPLVVDDEEAVAIAVGLRTAAGQAVQGMEEASVRALTKLEQVLPSRLRYRVRTLSQATVPLLDDRQPAVDPEHLAVLAATTANRERVDFRYQRGDGTEGRRRVEPHGLVPAGRRWYLIAFDLDREDWRTFRVDRIRTPEPTGVRVQPRTLPAADAAAYLRGLRTGWNIPTYRAVVTLHAPAREVAGRLGDAPGDVVPVDERTCRLDSTRDDSVAWLAGRLAMLGCEFQAHEPPELAASLRALAARAARAAGPAPSR